MLASFPELAVMPYLAKSLLTMKLKVTCTTSRGPELGRFLGAKLAAPSLKCKRLRGWLTLPRRTMCL